MRILIVIVLILLNALLAHGQTHTMFGSNVVPAGASLTIQSGASITAAAGSTITGFGGGSGSVAWGAITGTLSAQTDLNTALSGKQPLDSDLTSIAALTTTAFGRDFLTQLDAPGARGYISAQSLDTDLTAIAALTTTSYGRAFLALADATGAHGYLALTPGVNVQAWDADLTSWAAVTRASGVDTWIATPSSANLRTTVTDGNGTGALLFSGATTPDFTTGITVGGAAASNKVMKGDGTKFAASTSTEAEPGTSGNVMTSDGTNWTSAAPVPHAVYAAASPPTTDVGSFTIVKTGVDFKTNATTDLFTVPTGRTFLCTAAWLVPTTVVGGASVAIVWKIQESGASVAMTAATAASGFAPVTTKYWIQATTIANSPYGLCAAGNKVQLSFTTAWTTSTTVTGSVFVQGFYTQ